MNEPTDNLQGIAIIGMAGKFPGADGVDELWQNLLAGRETISTLAKEELASGEPSDDPDYVSRRGLIREAESFDAPFFKMSRVEAEVTDPQQRVFLEVCWSALEHAGYDPQQLPGLTGVWAGSGNNHYHLKQLLGNDALLETAGSEAVMIGNEKDYIATRVAYKLNLRGPAINVVTACSTSLVAVCQAVQSLMTFQCDLALAGGSSIRWPQNRGYLHQEGGIFSPDGHCRAFDERSAGTVFSSGCGCVILKRLEDAVREGDVIYAVIKGASINNDGSGKVSFTAPGVAGQADNIAMALAMADVSPESIGYVEAHGTGTALGDVIEVSALTQAFRGSGDGRTQECALGSLKTSVGHMDAAAGVGGLIKTALALHHGVIPPTLHFQRANPKLELNTSPFRVVNACERWERRTTPRRALVAALGVGGTNAHVVLEEWAKATERVEPARGNDPQLLVLSARSEQALSMQAEQLAAHFEVRAETKLEDVACTFARGRTAFPWRRAVVAASNQEAIDLLREKETPGAAAPASGTLAFLFPGQGAQYAGMGRGLAGRFAVLADELERCRAILGFDPLEGTDDFLAQTANAQPALFCLSYALARLVQSWGISPNVLIGHSIGEYAAATLAGVFSLEEALSIVIARGRAMQKMPPGIMLAVRCPEQDLSLPAALDLAAVNAPGLCVVSGLPDDIASYEAELVAKGVGTRRLKTSHAFHSRLMEPTLDEFRRAFCGVTLRAPQGCVISNVSGVELTEAQATDPEYWVNHLRSTVRFSRGLSGLGQAVCLELGPGQVLTGLARQNGLEHAIASLGSPAGQGADEPRHLLVALGKLWSFGLSPDWSAFFAHTGAKRVALPTYPFERQTYCPASPAAVSTIPSRPMAEPRLENRPPAPPPPASAASRKERLLEELHDQFLKISGVQTRAHPATTPLLDLGFDSLFLTQAGMALKKHFGVKITFRQLMEELTSLEALAFHLDAQLPPDQFSPGPIPAAIPEAAAKPASSHPADDSVSARLERIEAAVSRLAGTGFSAAGPSAAEKPRPGVPVRELSFSGGNKIAFGPFRPVEKSADGSLSSRQRAHLQQLIRGYCGKFPKSKQFTADHRPHFADPRAVGGFNPLWKEMVFPLVTDRSEGAHLWDIDDNRWIDVVHGFGSGLFGHRPPFVIEALKSQLDRGIEIGPTHPLAGEVALLVREFSGLDRVAFCNTGSEALMAAIRVSRTVTGRDTIAMFAGSYHGIFDEVLARPLVTNGELRTIPIAPGIPESALRNIIVLEYGHPESLEIIRRHGSELAAVLVEPVPSRRPDIAPFEFVRELRQITRESGTSLIFDEVVLGFRTHPRGAQHLFGIQADLVAYGKVIGGGLPLGVLAGTGAFMDALDGGSWQYGDASAPEVGVTFFAGTFIRHPLALAAARAILLRLRAEGPALQADLDARTAAFVGRLNGLFEEAGVPVKVTRFSSLWMLNADPSLKYFSLLFYHLRLRGVHIWEGRGNFISLAHTPRDLDDICQAFQESVRTLQDGGFFPEGEYSQRDQAVRAVAGNGRPVEAVNGRRSAPLTPEQQEVFLASRLGAEASLAFHESVTLEISGKLSVDRLKSALEELMARHDALRISISPDGGTQHVLEEIAPDFTVAAGSSEDEIAREYDRPIDLTRAPLWRAKLISRGPHDHALILTGHHIVLDGWSWGIIVRELAALYRGESLAPAPQYIDYARQTAPDAEAASYWQEQFRTLPPVLDLPGDGSRPSQLDFAAQTVKGRLPTSLSQKLRGFARARRQTPNTILLTAWQALLSRLSGQSDIVVGTPMAGQPGSDWAGMVGHCVHFLPLRTQLDPEASAEQAMALTRSLVIDAAEHQNFTLGQLLPLLKLDRSDGRLAFASNTFTLENEDEPLSLGEATAGVVCNPKRRLLFDLSLFIQQSADGFGWLCVFQEALFQRTTIERWMGWFANLLGALIEEPEKPLSSLTLLTREERTTIVQHWNRHGEEPPPEATIHALVADMGRQRPDAVAVTFGLVGTGLLRYRELDQRANQFAHELVSCGVKRGDLVAVLLERSLEMVIALLGILKAGAAYAPIDPNYPQERVRFLLEDTGAQVVVTQDDLRVRLAGAENVRLLSVEAESVDAQATTPPEVTTTPDDLAYVVYTSGSTGEPKGVAVPHRAVVRLVRNNNFATLDEKQTWLQLAPLPFDASTLEIWGPLCNGGRLAVMTPASPTLADIGLAIREMGVTSLWLTAGLFELMVDEEIGCLEPLQQLLTGGDVVSPLHARKVLNKYPRLRLINGYGPTENTTFTCCHTIQTSDCERPSLPIGRPIAHGTVYVLDAGGEPAPPGLPGELYTEGLGLARGYWNREALTRERFIEHHEFGRLYRTGDLVRWLPEGVIEFLGRLDNQVKVRGFRIEPGEIEARLAGHPSVKRCVVVANGSRSGEKRLVAYYVPTGTEAERPENLREFLSRDLPEYSLPTAFVALKSGLPLTANGKVDLRRLPDSVPMAPELSPPNLKPRNDVERRLCELWEETIERNNFGVQDNFFDLGGDSLRGLRLFARIEREFGRSLPLGTLFTAPTIEKLAVVLGSSRSRLPSLVVPIQEQGWKRPFFCVHGGDGGVVFYKAMAAGLGHDRPVFGIEAPMLTNSALLAVEESVEKTAKSYLSALREVQPEGPYLLGGYSFGGVVAYEMARQLRRSGDEVALLALFDTDNPAVPPKYFSLGQRLLARWQIDASAGLSLPGRLANLGGRVKSGLFTRARQRQELAVIREHAESQRRAPEELRPIEVREAHAELMAAYRPGRYDGRMILFRCSDKNDKFEHTPALGWEGVVTGGIEVVAVPGVHLDLFNEANVRVLSEKLQAFLEVVPS